MTFAVRSNPRSPTRLPRVSLLGWALVLVAACTRGEGAETEAPRGMVAELARAVGPAPTLGPRLSIAREPSECASEAGCRETGTPSRRVNTVAARASQAARASVAPDALHASALFDLLWADDAGTSLRRSIQYLQTAARLDPRPASILADLSAAHLVRAERANSPRDLLEAVETAERALQKDPANRAALFNRALGLERFGLMGEAGRSWRAYLAADSTSDWADAARKRLAEVSRFPVLPKPPSANATDAELAAYAVADPQGARTMGWDHLLGEWGAAVLANDAAKAADRLHRAEVLGNALERAGRDATLADAVHAIRAHAVNADATRTLAAAHEAFARGRAAYQEADYPGSLPLFTPGIEATPLSATLGLWARAFAGAAAVQSGDAEIGARLLEAAAASVDAARYPAAAGRIGWFRATSLLRTDRYEQSWREAQNAAALLAEAGERENQGAAMAIGAGATFELGEVDAGYAATQTALQLLRPFPASIAQHILLFSLSETVAAADLGTTAVRVAGEGISVAERMGKDAYRAEVHLARARLLAGIGRYAEAEKDLSVGREMVERLTEVNARAWFTADLALVEAGVAHRGNPARAVAVLDSAIQFFHRARVPVRLLPALVARARAKLALDNVAGATGDLDSALDLLDYRRRNVVTPVLRASLMRAARGVIDEAAMSHVRAGRPALAALALERARARLTTTRGADRTDLRASRGELILSYALVGDTLLIWSAIDSDLTLTRVSVDKAEIIRTINRLNSALELGSDAVGVQDALHALHERLIQPVRGRLAMRAQRLTLIVDGELGAVPFAALRNPRTGRYLVEDREIRFATSFADAHRVHPGPGLHISALVVADPAFNARANLGFERLAGAVEEARAVASMYPARVELAGPAATQSAVVTAMQSAEMVHYAGHAVFDENHPSESFLLLAPPADANGSDRLTGAMLASADLQGTGLVILSACQTARVNGEPSSGFSGLAGAFLLAGAGGVIGSLWRVEDESVRDLMQAFHATYRVQRSPAAALRAAQLAAISSQDPKLRSPAAWAAFRLIGGSFSPMH